MATRSNQTTYSPLVTSIMFYMAHPMTNPCPAAPADMNELTGVKMADVALSVVQMRYFHGVSFPDPGQSFQDFFSFIMTNNAKLDQFTKSVVIAHCDVDKHTYATGGNIKISDEVVARLKLDRIQVAAIRNCISFIRIHNNLIRLATAGRNLYDLISIAEFMATTSIK